MKLLPIFILTLLLTVSSASATTWYVSNTDPGCNDAGPGTIETPLCTLNSANQRHNGGDTVYIMSGEYRESIFPRAGTPGQYTIFSGYGNREDIKILGSEEVTNWVKCTVGDPYCTGASTNVYYASFSNDYRPRCLVYADTDCWEDRQRWYLPQTTLSEIDQSGEFYFDYNNDRVYIWTFDGQPALSHTIECSNRSTAPLHSEYIAFWPPGYEHPSYFVIQNLTFMQSFDDGIVMDGTVHHVNITNNEFAFISGGGSACGSNPGAIVHHKDTTYCGPGTTPPDLLCMKEINVVGNLIHDIGSGAGPGFGNPTIHFTHGGAAIKAYDVRDSLIADNVIYNVDQGIDMKQRTDMNIIRNNILSNFNSGIGFLTHGFNTIIEGNILYGDASVIDDIHLHVGGPTDNLTFVHNVIYAIPTGKGFAINAEVGDTIRNYFKNNILVELAEEVVVVEMSGQAELTDSNHNIYHDPAGLKFRTFFGTYYDLPSWVSASGHDVNSSDADPQFVSTNPASPDFLKLSATSPAIDAGELIPGYHCDYADDDPINPMDPAADCRHWSGSAPDIGAIEYVDTGPDTTPPVRSNGQPTGTLASGTTQATISLTTNEAATCKYGTTPGVSYDSMTNTFSTTGGTTHSQLITGLTDGGSYAYYVRCNDLEGNKNMNDYSISFSVATPPVCEDTNNDNKVNIIDLAMTVFWQGKSSGDADWQHFDHIDVNQDGQINFGDVADVITNFGQSC